MTFAFPTTKSPRKMKPRLISAAQEPEGNGAGVDQRFITLGSRFAVDVTMPPMRYADARLVVAALLRAEREEMTMLFLQPGLSIGAPGARTVSPIAAANATVVGVLGGSVYTVLGGQFFNLTDADGRKYLHAAVQTNNIPGNLIIAPALRQDFAVGRAYDFATPVIQGFVRGKETAWDVDEAHHYGVSFTIKECK